MNDYRQTHYHQGDDIDAVKKPTGTNLSCDPLTTPGVSIVKPPEKKREDLATPATPQTDFADGLIYDLTLKQVPEILQEANREVPSSRTLQRICSEGNSVLKCRKIKTSYGQEWLVNNDSLYEYVDAQPIKIMDEDVTNDMPATSDASVAKAPTEDFSAGSERENAPPVQANDTPVNGDASDAEQRTLAEVLIENSKLIARDEVKDELIGELRDDKAFLRETVREDRKHRGEVKGIADKMLETMRDMALGSRLKRGEDEGSFDGGKVGS